MTFWLAIAGILIASALAFIAVSINGVTEHHDDHGHDDDHGHGAHAHH